MPSMPAAQPTRVLLVCSGLDHASRGFESFARECFVALRDEPGLDLRLIKGSGPPDDRERSVPTLRRDGNIARAFGRIFGNEPFRFEQLAFALSLQPLLISRPPEVVYFSEWHTGIGLSLLRRITRQRFRLVLCNGTSAAEGFKHLDLVQELTPAALETVLERGADPTRQTMLPLGFTIEPSLELPSQEDRQALRRRLNLPVDRPIVLSVAALNRQKRIDYLIEELGRMPEPRPFLLLVGQAEAETADLRAFASRRLGDDGHSVRSVPQPEVSDLYRASDAFVLASLGEAFGRVLIEAMAHGLPCLAYDYAITRFVLGPYGHLADLTQPGALQQLIVTSLAGAEDHRSAHARHRFAYENFSWERLRPRYVQMLSGARTSPVS